MPATILVVDDDIYIRSFLQKRLTALNYEVLLAENGAEGLAAARERRPHLIVSDWMMPVMDGKEFCQRVKNDEELRYTYFILLTARDTAEDKIEGMEYGADDFMTKPFNDKELVARIKVGLRITALQQELSKYQHEKAVTELAVTIGHEINNPLGIIMLTLQVMKKKIGTEREAEFAADIESLMANGNRVADIVKRLCSLDELQFKPYLKNSDLQMLDLTGKP
ncbi:MAG: response regulator [Bacteroidetes bacterium]|nr:MAG: response regulator [Bacteroidota bacterium]